MGKTTQQQNSTSLHELIIQKHLDQNHLAKLPASERTKLLSQKNDDGLTPIAYAASQNQWDDVLKIANTIKLADKTELEEDAFGYSEALMYAIIKGNIPVITTLLNIPGNKFADVLEKKLGYSCLHLAIHHRKEAVITTLLNLNVSMDGKFSYQKNTQTYDLDVINHAYMHSKGCLRSLASHPRGQQFFHINRYFHDGVDDAHGIQECINAGFDPNLRDKTGKFALEHALEGQHSKSFEILLKNSSVEACRQLILNSEKELSSQFRKQIVNRLRELHKIPNSQTEAAQALADVYRMKKAPGWHIFRSQESKARRLYKELAENAPAASELTDPKTDLASQAETAFLTMAGSDSKKSGLAAAFLAQHANDIDSKIYCQALVYSAIVWGKKSDLDKAKRINTHLAMATYVHADKLIQKQQLFLDKDITADITQRISDHKLPSVAHTHEVLGPDCLHRAIRSNDITKLSVVLDTLTTNKYSFPHLMLDNGRTPIQVAAAHKRWDMVALLAESKFISKPKMLNIYGDVLIDALRENQKAAALSLIKNNAVTRWYSKTNNYNCLHWAIHHHSDTNDMTEIFVELLKHVTIEQYKNFCLHNGLKKCTPIKFAAFHKNWDFIELLAQHQHTDENDQLYYGDILIDVVKFNQYATAKTLIDAGASFHWSSHRNRFSALHWAIYNHTPTHDNTEMVNLFMNSAKALKQQDSNDLTPIEYALAEKKWDLVAKFSTHPQLHTLNANIIENIIHQCLLYDQIEIANAYLNNFSQNHSINELVDRAINRTNTSSLRYLIQANAYLQDQISIITNPVFIKSAIQNNNWESVQLLDPLADNKQPDEYLLFKYIELRKDKDDDLKSFIFSKLEDRANKGIISAKIALADIYRLNLAPGRYWFTSQKSKAETIYADIKSTPSGLANIRAYTPTEFGKIAEIQQMYLEAFSATVDYQTNINPGEAVSFLKKEMQNTNSQLKAYAMVLHAIIWGDKDLLTKALNIDIKSAKKALLDCETIIRNQESLIKGATKAQTASVIDTIYTYANKDPVTAPSAPPLPSEYAVSIQPSAPMLPSPAYNESNCVAVTKTDVVETHATNIESDSIDVVNSYPSIIKPTMSKLEKLLLILKNALDGISFKKDAYDQAKSFHQMIVAGDKLIGSFAEKEKQINAQSTMFVCKANWEKEIHRIEQLYGFAETELNNTAAGLSENALQSYREQLNQAANQHKAICDEYNQTFEEVTAVEAVEHQAVPMHAC